MKFHRYIMLLMALLLVVAAACDQGGSASGKAYGAIKGPVMFRWAQAIGEPSVEFPDIDFVNLPIEPLTYQMRFLTVARTSAPAIRCFPGSFFYLFGDNFGIKPDLRLGGMPMQWTVYYGQGEFGTLLLALPPETPCGNTVLTVCNSRGSCAELPLEVARLGLVLEDDGRSIRRFLMPDGVQYYETLSLPGSFTAAAFSRDGALIILCRGESLYLLPASRTPLEICESLGCAPDGSPAPFELALPSLPGGQSGHGNAISVTNVPGTTRYAVLFPDCIALLDAPTWDEFAFAYRWAPVKDLARYSVSFLDLPAAGASVTCTPDGRYAVVPASDGSGVSIIPTDGSAATFTDFGTGFRAPGTPAFTVGADAHTRIFCPFGDDGASGNEGRLVSLDLDGYLEGGGNVTYAAVAPGAHLAVISGETVFVLSPAMLEALNSADLAYVGSLPLPGGDALVYCRNEDVFFILNAAGGSLLRADVSAPAAMTSAPALTALPSPTTLASQH